MLKSAISTHGDLEGSFFTCLLTIFFKIITSNCMLLPENCVPRGATRGRGQRDYNHSNRGDNYFRELYLNINIFKKNKNTTG